MKIERVALLKVAIAEKMRTPSTKHRFSDEESEAGNKHVPGEVYSRLERNGLVLRKDGMLWLTDVGRRILEGVPNLPYDESGADIEYSSPMTAQIALVTVELEIARKKKEVFKWWAKHETMEAKTHIGEDFRTKADQYRKCAIETQTDVDAFEFVLRHAMENLGVKR